MGLTCEGVEPQGEQGRQQMARKSCCKAGGASWPAEPRWALTTDSRPAITQAGRHMGDREVIHRPACLEQSDSALCVAGCPCRPPFPPAVLFFSWHCAWSGERVSACFSNSPLGGRTGRGGHTSLLCRGKRTRWSASNDQNYRMVDGISK